MTTMPQHASTPPAGTGTIPQSLSLKSLSTPFSRGSGSHHSHQSQHYQDHYKPYLREDLAHQYKPEIPFDVFLNDILCHGLSLDNADQLQNHEIVSDKQFQTLLSKFCEPVHQETGHYTPFIELTNYVIGQFNNPESRIVFCRNDPVSIRGSDAIRKPDVVVVLDKSLEVPERGGVNNLMKGGPKQVPFWWTELLAFFEFKRVEKCLEPVRGDDRSRALPSPSTPRTTCDEHSLSMMNPHLASPSLNPSAPESKRSANTLSSNPSPRSKRQKLDSPGIDTKTDTMLQCASYALEILSHGGLRSHVIGASVTDGTIQLLYYDRSIILRSESLNFLEDPSSFVAMLRAMCHHLPRSQLGHANLVTPPSFLESPRRSNDIFDGLTLTLNDGAGLRLGSIIHLQHGIIGRGTCVVRAMYIDGTRAHCDDVSWAGPLVVKLSWPAKSTDSENDLIAKARTAADHADHCWVVKHLPNVLQAEDRQIESLSPALIARIGGAYKKRVLRIIVQEELYPIIERTNAVDLAQSFREVFKCYRWLYEVPKILHRDISLNNLMLRKKGDNVYAVLNDLDLSVDVDVQSPSSKHRTGTKPFMAIDLLSAESAVHLYRHDLESLFYVLVWITSRFDEGVEIPNPPFQKWAEGRLQEVKNLKIAFLKEPFLSPTKRFISLGRHISSMRAMFNWERLWREMKQEVKTRVLEDSRYDSGHGEPELSHFDDDTLGGSVTFDKFEKILNADVL